MPSLIAIHNLLTNVKQMIDASHPHEISDEELQLLIQRLETISDYLSRIKRERNIYAAQPPERTYHERI